MDKNKKTLIPSFEDLKQYFEPEDDGYYEEETGFIEDDAAYWEIRKEQEMLRVRLGGMR